MSTAALALVGMAISSSAVAQANPQQFDLTCTGTVLVASLGRGNVMNRSTTPFTKRFRFDLSRRLFCDGDCSRPTQMFAVTDTELILGVVAPVVGRIDRMSGVYKQTVTNQGYSTAWYDGVCIRENYSGIPAARF